MSTTQFSRRPCRAVGPVAARARHSAAVATPASAPGGARRATADGAVAALALSRSTSSRVVEQPLDRAAVTARRAPPYQSVAIHSRVTGFVKTIAVDRGSSVRAGDVLATLDAPELVAQRAEAQSKLQAAEAQLAGAQAKADADRGTYDKLEAASATPGVVAGNDVLRRRKGGDAAASRSRPAGRMSRPHGRPATSIREMEGYLRVTAPFAGVVTERNVHPGALVGPGGGTTPCRCCAWSRTGACGWWCLCPRPTPPR